MTRVGYNRRGMSSGETGHRHYLDMGGKRIDTEFSCSNRSKGRHGNHGCCLGPYSIRGSWHSSYSCKLLKGFLSVLLSEINQTILFIMGLVGCKDRRTHDHKS